MTRPRTPTWTVLLACGLLLGACSGTTSTPSPSAEPDPTPEATVSPEPTETPMPTDEPSPSEDASAAPSSTPTGGGGFTVAPNPEADALFLDRDMCENRRDGYRLQFPDDWYTNTEFRDFAPCVWFSPTFYETTGDEVPPEIGITIEWVPGDVGSFEERISQEEVTVGFQPAFRTEYAGAAGEGGLMPPDWRMYRYVIQLGPTSEEGPNLVVTTTNESGGEYEVNKAVMDRMMATIEFIGSVQ